MEHVGSRMYRLVRWRTNLKRPTAAYTVWCIKSIENGEVDNVGPRSLREVKSEVKHLALQFESCVMGLHSIHRKILLRMLPKWHPTIQIRHLFGVTYRYVFPSTTISMVDQVKRSVTSSCRAKQEARMWYARYIYVTWLYSSNTTVNVKVLSKPIIISYRIPKAITMNTQDLYRAEDTDTERNYADHIPRGNIRMKNILPRLTVYTQIFQTLSGCIKGTLRKWIQAVRDEKYWKKMREFYPPCTAMVAKRIVSYYFNVSFELFGTGIQPWKSREKSLTSRTPTF